MKFGDKRLISKEAGSTNAGKKALATTLQVCHLLPQSLEACISGINNRLNPPHEEGPGNLTKMIQNKLHGKTHASKLLYRNPPLQDPLFGDGVNEVMLNVIHHAPY